MTHSTTTQEKTARPLHFIGDEILANGFALAGLVHTHVYREGIIDDIEDELIDDDGILAVSNKYAQKIDDRLKTLRNRGILTVIVPDETGGEDLIQSHLATGGIPTQVHG